VTSLELNECSSYAIEPLTNNRQSQDLARAFPNLKFLQLLSTSTIKEDLKNVFTWFTGITRLTLVFGNNEKSAGENDAWDELTGGAERVSEGILLIYINRPNS